MLYYPWPHWTRPDGVSYDHELQRIFYSPYSITTSQNVLTDWPVGVPEKQFQQKSSKNILSKKLPFSIL